MLASMRSAGARFVSTPTTKQRGQNVTREVIGNRCQHDGCPYIGQFPNYLCPVHSGDPKLSPGGVEFLEPPPGSIEFLEQPPRRSDSGARDV